MIIILARLSLIWLFFRASIQARLVDLHVESRNIDFIESGLYTPPNSGDDGRRKKRKVRFNFDDSPDRSTIASTAVTIQDPGTVDLRAAKSICAILQGTSVDSCVPKCLGYLDTCCDETFRHSFFGTAAPRPVSESVCISTEEILKRPAERSVTLVDQLTLARNIAMAVLKFHSTPWLRDYVTIQDFSFFCFDESDMSSCIQTAHLGSDFVHTRSRENFPSPMDGIVDDEAIEDAKLAHGIRNLTLWGLGTVMYVSFEQQILTLLDPFFRVEHITFRVRTGASPHHRLSSSFMDNLA